MVLVGRSLVKLKELEGAGRRRRRRATLHGRAGPVAPPLRSARRSFSSPAWSSPFAATGWSIVILQRPTTDADDSVTGPTRPQNQEQDRRSSASGGSSRHLHHRTHSHVQRPARSRLERGRAVVRAAALVQCRMPPSTTPSPEHQRMPVPDEERIGDRDLAQWRTRSRALVRRPGDAPGRRAGPGVALEPGEPRAGAHRAGRGLRRPRRHRAGRRGLRAGGRARRGGGARPARARRGRRHPHPDELAVGDVVHRPRRHGRDAGHRSWSSSRCSR